MNILVVIDVVVCGIDILVFVNVINYDFFLQFKVFVYCVGCMVCVGQCGWVYVFVWEFDLFYFIDFQFFFGWRLVMGKDG